MNKIEKLIEELCPEGVPTVRLGDHASYVRGLTYSKSDELNGGPIRVLRSNNIDFEGSVLNFESVKTLGSAAKAKHEQLLRRNDILISAASGSRAHVGKVAYIYEDMDFYFGGFMAVLRSGPDLDSRYLFHVLTSSRFRDYLDQAVDSTTINNLNAQIMGSFPVPLPPVKVQQEIVLILDKFTELEAELEAELQNRVLQMHHFKSSLLFGPASSESSDRFRLTDVAEASWGNTSLTKSSYSPITGRYTAYSATGPDGLLEHFEVEGSGVVLSAIGARCGKTWLAEGKWTCIKNTIWFRSRDENSVLNSWLYWITSEPELWPSSSSAQPFISLGDVKKMELWIPPIEEQKRLVGIMEGFMALATASVNSLPAEIQARRKQYEYYRNKLLAFKEHDAA